MQPGSVPFIEVNGFNRTDSSVVGSELALTCPWSIITRLCGLGPRTLYPLCTILFYSIEIEHWTISPESQRELRSCQAGESLGE